MWSFLIYNIMREIFEAINDYPWTTFLCWLMIFFIVCAFGEIINNKK